MIRNEAELRDSLEELGRFLRDLAEFTATVPLTASEGSVATADSCCRGIGRIRLDIKHYLDTLPPIEPTHRSAQDRYRAEILNDHELRFSLTQMGRLMHALDSMRATMLGKNPRNFFIFADAVREDIDRIRSEAVTYLRTMKAAG